MTSRAHAISLRDAPELTRVVKEILEQQMPTVLRSDTGEDLLMLIPLRKQSTTGGLIGAATKKHPAKVRLLEHFQSVPALAIEYTDGELTELAADEAASEFARRGY